MPCLLVNIVWVFSLTKNILIFYPWICSEGFLYLILRTQEHNQAKEFNMIKVERVYINRVVGKGTETRFRASFENVNADGCYGFNSVLGIESAVQGCKFNLIQNYLLSIGEESPFHIAVKAMKEQKAVKQYSLENPNNEIYKKIVSILDLPYTVV